MENKKIKTGVRTHAHKYFIKEKQKKVNKFCFLKENIVEKKSSFEKNSIAL